MSSSARLRQGLMPPTEALDLGSGLSLSPRLRLLLTFFRSDTAVRPIDEWQLKRALLDFLRDSLSLTVPEEDLLVRKRADLQKRKREDPVASGSLCVRDLGFLKKKKYRDEVGDEEKDVGVLRERFGEWRETVVSRMEGIELNTEGVKFRMTVEVPAADDYERLKKSWEEFFAWKPSGNRYSKSSITRRPDTIIVKGLPSRWFAEPRVSSKPSMLVTHTIFSALGKIRNLNVAGEDGLGKTAEDTKGDIVSGLHCKIWVQFENYDDFCHALNALCGRSLIKQGSRLKADYEVACDTEGYFRNINQRTERNHIQESAGQIQVPSRHLKVENSRFQSRVTRLDSDDAHPKRFRE